MLRAVGILPSRSKEKRVVNFSHCLIPCVSRPITSSSWVPCSVSFSVSFYFQVCTRTEVCLPVLISVLLTSAIYCSAHNAEKHCASKRLCLEHSTASLQRKPCILCYNQCFVIATLHIHCHRCRASFNHLVRHNLFCYSDV